MVARMFKRIIVGYAGDLSGRDGVMLGYELAAMCGAEITVVYPYHPLLAAVPCDVAEARARDELEAMLDEEGALAGATFRWSNSSWPIHALHELAVHEHADLIVFGSAPERLERRHISLMERMVHGAPCAVAVAPDGYAERKGSSLREVGVGFADSAEGRAAITVGCRLAGLAGAGVKILAASGLSASLAGYAALATALPTVEEEMYNELKARLARVAGELAGESQPELEVHRGDPCRMLLAASTELDLLVLGSRGYGPLRHALLGSVSAPVMRAARCPVLVLPREAPVTQTAGASQTALAEH
jgi:nucleotide-binding universal stress UspA family protein